ncbi:MAG: phosphoribosylformylglycinamidine synthase II, partial [Leptolyngbya sp. SIO4C1]|nr:phosphoribosylformylglycinamidine synthase II [Leptolyngbya sp. SIO4C1]
PTSTLRWDELLFSEGGARIVVSVAAAQIADWERYVSEQLALSWQLLGTVGGSELALRTADQQLIQLSLTQIAETWRYAIERALAD